MDHFEMKIVCFVIIDEKSMEIGEFLQSPLDTSDLMTTFEYLPASGMRIASLMLGDLEASDRFLKPFLQGMLPYPFLGFMFYGTCLIMLPVLLNNLLVSWKEFEMVGNRKAIVCKGKLFIIFVLYNNCRWVFRWAT